MKQMIRAVVLGALLIIATALCAQESVCDLFSHLDSADGRQVVGRELSIGELSWVGNYGVFLLAAATL
jgi:hypothetical protein